jgi:hypothetical protein
MQGVRQKVQLNVESLEDRKVPSTSSALVFADLSPHLVGQFGHWLHPSIFGFRGFHTSGYLHNVERVTFLS